MAPRDGSPRDRRPLPSTEALLAEFRLADSGRVKNALLAKIVDSTLVLADTAARSYRNRGIEHDDLTQVARLGLMKAIHGYDPASGGSFAAYALPTISGEIKRHFRDQGWVVRPPRTVQELRARMVGEEEVLRARLRRQPTTAEMAEHLGVEAEAVSETKVASRGYTAESLSVLTDGRRPVEPVAGGDPIGDVVEWESVRNALRILTPRQREVLGLRYVEDLTQSQIAVRVGVSQMQVSRILSRCMTRLRDEMDTERDTAAADRRRRSGGRHGGLPHHPEALAG